MAFLRTLHARMLQAKVRILLRLGLADPQKLRERQRRADMAHPERLAVLPYCSEGHGLEIGCGGRKSHPNCIGVDIVAGDAVGGVGGAAGTVSQADVRASGDDLAMFAENEMDFIVGRHILEHFTDPVKALLEWKRVLKRGGVMVLVVPDDRALNTVSLDPSHKHAFTPESLRNLLGVVGGFQVERLEVVIPNWSFLCVARKMQEPMACG